MSQNNFSEFYESILKLAKSFEQKDILVKILPDLEANIIRIYGEKTDPLSLAKVGLEEISELAYTTAEHHPYWNLIYTSSQILKIVLDRWDEDLTNDDLVEILWNADKIKNTGKKFEATNSTAP